MIIINSNKEEETLEIEIISQKKSKIKIAFLFMISIGSLIFFLLFTLAALSDPVQFGFATMFVLVFLMSFIPLLWALNGKERIEINSSEIKQILDYGWFKDKTSLPNQNIRLEIDFQKSNKKLSERILDSDLEKYQNNGIIRFKKKNNVLIEINTTISKSDLENLENSINEYLK